MEILIILSSILIILIGYPIFFVILFLCILYKQIILWLVRKDPKIRKKLDGINAVLAGQEPYTDPIIVVVPYITLNGKLDVPTVVKALKEKVIELNIYPELSQRIVQKYGYHFWYTVDNFQVEKHVRYLHPECPNRPVTRSELRDLLCNKLGKLPFDSSKSPWEILIVPNLIDDRDPEVKAVFILRANHCLMDGYSVSNFMKKFSSKFWKVLGEQRLEQMERNKSKFVKIYKFVSLFFLGPYHLLKMFVFSKDHHKFVQNTYKPDCREFYNSQCTPAISENRLKSVKNAFGVKMSSVITTLFGQAIVKCMRKSEIKASSRIHGSFSFPVPGHLDILSNHWSLVRIPIEVNEADPLKTLKSVNKEFKSLANSVKPLVFFYVNQLIALIPLWLRPNTKSIIPTTFVSTNFPGTSEPVEIFGCMVKKYSLSGKPSRGVAFISGSFSVAGKIWLDIGGPVCNLKSQQDADELSESIMDTLRYLEARIPEISN